jgi:hypothetical protein
LWFVIAATVICLPVFFRRNALVGLVGLLLAGWLAWTLAYAHLDMHLETQSEVLLGPGWRAENVGLTVRQDGTEPGFLYIRIERLRLPLFAMVLTDISLRCTAFVWHAKEIRCAAGQLQMANFQGKPLQGQIRFTYRRIGNQLTLTVTELNVAQGQLAINGTLKDTGWQATVKAVALESADLADWLMAVPDWPFDRQQTRGRLTFEVDVAGRGTTVDQLRLQMTSSALQAAAGAGRFAVQDLAFQLKGQWHFPGRFAVQLVAFSGQVYLAPVFFALPPQGAAPLTVSAAGHLENEQWHITALRFAQPEVVSISARLVWELTAAMPLQTLDVTLKEAIFPAAYETYLRPVLAHTSLGQLHTRGRIRGRLQLAAGALQSVELELSQVALEDREDRFAGSGMQGRIIWSTALEVQRSALHWDGGHIHRLPVGAGELTLESAKGRLRLLHPVRIPLLDGAVIIERLEGQGLAADELRWQFAGLLTPVALEKLSQALNWPPLTGKLSATFPDVRYTGQRLEIGDALVVHVFGGKVILSQLRITDPFGEVPNVYADLLLHNLDLLSLTRSFDFGTVEGKLAGRITNLHLANWQPIYFDAEFATPAEDRSRHRISQRAIANISALGGGGATAALSRGFLGLFESFRYRRLGIQCRLVNGICEMDGIAPAGKGYYLVEGEGLPRIDVIGYHRRVDWQELLIRLQAASRSGKPVVK